MATAARSVSRYLGFFKKMELNSVLDYGAGTLRNARFLAAEGFAVYAADLPAQVARIVGMAGHDQLAGVLATDQLEESRLAVDLVLSSYVFNIIPDGSEKSRYLENIVLNLRPEGYLLMEVRCRGQEAGCCAPASRCQECTKTYSHHELDQVVTPLGFSRVSHYYRHRAVAVLYQKRNS